MSKEFKTSLLDMIGTVTYLICGDSHINIDDFTKIMTSRNVPKKLFQLADGDKDNDLTVKEVMDFLVVLSAPM